MFALFSKAIFVIGLLLISCCMQACATSQPAKSSPLTEKPQQLPAKPLKMQATPPTTRHVTINKQKFELISQHKDHWLLFDPQTGQYCTTLNQIVVITTALPALLRQISWPYQVQEWNKVAEDTYRWTGTFSKAIELHSQLKKAPDVQFEWQLQYRAHSQAEEM